MWKRIQKDPHVLSRLIAADVVFGIIVLVDGVRSGRPILLWIGVGLFVSSLAILAFYIRKQMRAHKH